MSAIWFVLTFAAVLWPARFLGPLDGMPLDRPVEAIVLGLALPWLFWLGRDACRSRTFRIAVVALLCWKAGTSLVASQQGLCASVRAPGPVSGSAFDMLIDEPRGFLRSWDVRADLWADEPACTAILSRPLRTTAEFPAWFVNFTDQLLSRRNFTMDVHGFVTRHGASQPIAQSVALDDGPWVFDPMIDGVSLWQAGLVTTAPPTAIDRALAPWAWLIAPTLCAIIAGLLLRTALQPILGSTPMVIWVMTSSVVAIGLAATTSSLARLSGAIGIGLLALRLPPLARNNRTMVWLIGAPWLAFFAAYSASTIGELTAYSMDDWLAYQLAGYRIFVNGHWLEAGSLTFGYQPLYRWITGALHLVFGDSSVGEWYWDASCLLVGALLAFELTARSVGSWWGTAAAALTLATLTIATPWYIIGRGLPDISAAGFAFAAMWCVLHGRDHGQRWIVLGAVFAAMTFYTRLNHLLWAPCLVALIIPMERSSDFRRVRVAVADLPWRSIASYFAVLAVSIVAFMTRTWYFTGSFSFFHGTALRFNDTGLRPWHVIDGEVWRKIGHSLAGLIFMNEPPHADLRAIVVLSGAIVTVLATLQFPPARKVPLALLLVTLGSVLAAFLAHSHAYPGRFTVHLIPLASAMTAVFVAGLFRTADHPAVTAIQ